MKSFWQVLGRLSSLFLHLHSTGTNTNQDITCVSPVNDCIFPLPECHQVRNESISKTVTKLGQPCDLSDEVGCRFANNYFPWCWTNYTAGDYEYCYSFCKPCTNHRQTCGFNNRWECQQDGANFGRKNTTRKGLPCVNWKHTNYAHKFGDSNNCKATEYHAAYCFTKRPTSNDAGHQWDYCFPDCGLLRGKAAAEPTSKLRMMTFNLWRSGINVNDGPSKIAKHIKHINPDIVAAQEANYFPELFGKAMTTLGNNWTSVAVEHQSAAVIHRRQHLTDSVQLRNPNWNDLSTTVRVPINSNGVPAKLDVHVWAVYLAHKDYGPYKACEGECNSDILETEKERTSQVQTLLNDPVFQRAVARSDEEPVIVAGDFNCPSPQDWTPAARHLHCQRHFNWPATKLLLDAGFKDAYREVYPNPVTNPGATWSPVYIMRRSGGANTTVPEPQDRIDLIFYKGRKLRPVQAEVYAGLEPIKTGNPPEDYQSNDWPSDHSAVFVDFDIVS